MVFAAESSTGTFFINRQFLLLGFPVFVKDPEVFIGVLLFKYKDVKKCKEQDWEVDYS